jgi:hypothetical protein
VAKYAVLQTFYASSTWQAFRVAIIAERGLVCEHCHKPIAGAHEVTVHHIIELTPDNVQDANISLNPANILVVHRSCHDEIHSRFGRERGKRVYIVYGSPMSGKSTYVEQNMRRGDIVVDINRIFEAVSGLPAHDKPDSLLANGRAVEALLIDQIKTRFGKWSTAWVIGGFADKYKREKLADDLGAELVYCECSKEEAISRLDMDERRRNMKADYVRYIDEWWERFVP